MSARRDSLQSYRVSQATHAGLWFDKFAVDLSRSNKEARSKFVGEVANIKVPDCYKKFYETWTAALASYGQNDCLITTREAKVNGRMIIGTGNESVIETSVSLHKTYGVPYIPGSALKGLAASFARQFCGDEWSADSTAYKLVFGTTDESGCIVFFDAHFIPSSNAQPLRPDVLTVHHPEYYKASSTAPPADWDDPNPVPFLSATGSYLVALAASSDGSEWLKAIGEILTEALAKVGIGAKTSSGYGRMTLL